MGECLRYFVRKVEYIGVDSLLLVHARKQQPNDENTLSNERDLPVYSSE